MNTSFVPATPGNADAVGSVDLGQALPLPDSLNGAGGPNYVGQEAVLRRYWRIFIKRRWVIAGVILAVLLVGMAMAVLSQRLYSASARLQIAREAAQVIDLGNERPRPGVDQEFYQTQYALLKSRALAEAVVRDLRLADNEAFLTGFGQGDPAELPQQREIRERMAAGIVMRNTDVVPVRLSSVVDVRYTSPNPQLAAQVANAIADNFIQFNLSRRYEANSYARNFLQNQLGQVRQRLEDSERRAVGYAAQNQIINVAPTRTGPEGQSQAEQSLVTNSLTAANNALNDARAARIAAESRVRQATGGADPAEALQNSTVNALRQERAALRAQYERQLSDFGPEYPAVRAAAAQLAELDRQVAAETGRIRGSVSGDLSRRYQEALRTERELAQQVEQLKAGAIDLRRRSIQYNIFQRDVDTNRALYDALLQRYKEIGIAGGVGTNNVSIVDRALVPGSPFSPDIRLNILLSLLIGIVLGAGAALLLEQLDESAILPEDFQNKLGVPLLGSVPAIRNADPIELLSDPKSIVSEAYLSILTGLQFSTSHGTPRSLLTASTQPGEGKSTTALAIAQSIAKVGKQVVLIDGDMRNPSIHKVLHTDNKSGLSNLLVGDGTLDQHLLRTETPNLWAISSGPIPPNPAELLAGSTLEEVLHDALARFDHVVIDGPPVLGLADSPLLASAVEATIFVIEARRTRTGQARQAIRRLKAVRTPIVGAVLTKLDIQQAGYGYGYGYDYQYGH